MTTMTGATKVLAPYRKRCNRRLVDNLCAATGLASTLSSISWAAITAHRCAGQLIKTTTGMAKVSATLAGLALAPSSISSRSHVQVKQPADQLASSNLALDAQQ